MSRITRKELKTDKFALEVEHGISFFEHHKNEAVKYTAIAIGVIVLIALALIRIPLSNAGDPNEPAPPAAIM